MDPHFNPVLHNAKLHSTFASTTTTTTLPEPPNYAPPAYDMVVDPAAAIPNMRNAYDPSEDDKDDAEEIPEVTINSTTQIRGSGNIISVPPMDAPRIAGLLHTMMYGPPGQPSASPGLARAHMPRLHITVNCGATIFGDRNVVGPALGDVARQMQIARQQLAASQSQQARGMGASQCHQPVQAVPQPVQIPTPIRSRSGSESHSESQSESGRSEGSVAGVKRKVDDDEEE
ncbi:uncharacterized protein EI97DRAFT_351661, partial [Westerdykella ornata]